MDGKKINQEVEQFNKDKLRKTETCDKTHMPTQAAPLNGDSVDYRKTLRQYRISTIRGAK
ncbi:uncharacterized protein V6R79_013335 [Siganus canaliculatus]